MRVEQPSKAHDSHRWASDARFDIVIGVAEIQRSEIVALAPVDRIGHSRPTKQNVIAGSAAERIMSAITCQAVVAEAAEQIIISAATRKAVIAGAAIDYVGAGVAQ